MVYAVSMHVIVGLGNPGEEYKHSRHNVGRAIVEAFTRRGDFDVWKDDRKAHAQVAKGEYEGEKAALLLPDTFMNRSGTAVLPFVKSKKAAERLIVVYDDIDLPLGSLKLSFGRSSGGHKGVESIIRSLKTKDFVRVRVGISPATASGKVRKPKTEQATIDFLMKAFRKPEEEKLKKITKRVHEALEVIVRDGRAAAMNEFN